MSSIYLKRYAYPLAQTQDMPHPDLKLSVVIPSYNETGLLKSLQAIKECASPCCAVEVIVIVNDPENADALIKEANLQSYQKACLWAKDNNTERLKFLVFYMDALPKKHAGVGLARKIGMDEAVRRFTRIPYLNPEKAIIICFDADSLCDPNYLISVENHFLENVRSPGCSIYYEHPLEGKLTPELYRGITKYELYLRYYVHALRYAGFPYAYQTIGSSMAVRMAAYTKQGGMNRKKAGEDFYFLHKIIPLGNFTELKSTRVIPSPRVSERVPFGTGKAMGTWVNKTPAFYPAYHPATFKALKPFLMVINQFYDWDEQKISQWLQACPLVIREFLIEQHFIQEIIRIKNSSNTSQSFYNKFFEWFNGFMVLKYVHFARDFAFKDIPIEEAAFWLAKECYSYGGNGDSDKELLLFFRKLDKQEEILS